MLFLHNITLMCVIRTTFAAAAGVGHDEHKNNIYFIVSVRIQLLDESLPTWILTLF